MPRGPRFERLEPWLEWQQRLHPATIDLGLDRVSRVLGRTGWRRPDAPVITVGGTNGKGSCVALLASLLRAGGHRVGCFTSPHLVDYRERIRIDDVQVSEASLIAAFERITDALGDDSLTFFEFNTLAALLVFETALPDVLVLEVGLGGRLDAVNVVDPDVAVVVSVGRDHMEWLGPDEEAIGREKAGIFRADRSAVYGSYDPPRSIRDEARRLGARLQVRGEDFDGVFRDESSWNFLVGGRVHHAGLPRPALPGSIQVANAATALIALEALRPRIVIERVAIEQALRRAQLPGRLQRVDDARGFHWILDVAHNPAAAKTLAAHLRSTPIEGRTLAICGMLGDKDIPAVVAELRPVVDRWFAASAEGPRSIDAFEVARRAATVGVELEPVGSVADALQAAARDARPGDRVVVFGSFHTVGPTLAALGVPL